MNEDRIVFIPVGKFQFKKNKTKMYKVLFSKEFRNVLEYGERFNNRVDRPAHRGYCAKLKASTWFEYALGIGRNGW